MYTQCPDCQTRFRVTADALRAAHGTVRCGRCGSAFDALVRLSDTLPRAEPEVAPLPLLLATEEEFASFAEPGVELGVEPLAEPSNESTIVFVQEGGAGEDITLEGERVQIDGAVEALEERVVEEEVYDLDATDEFRLLEIPASAYPDEQEAERELEALVLRLQREFGPLTTGPGATPGARDDTTSEMPTLGELESPSAPPSEPASEVAPVEEIVLPAEMALEPDPVAEPTPEPAPVAPVAPPPLSRPTSAPIIVPVEERPLAARRWQPEPVELEQDAAPERTVWRTLAWSTGALLLVLSLAGQLAHHYRQGLARDARLGPPLRTAYERLGIALPPISDLESLELRQLGDEAREAGRLVVRASLTNRAGFDQPYPLLRLQFEDRFGSLIATRDFEPADYLTDPAQAARPMAPGVRSEAALVLADPGAEAVGYRLDVCLAESATMLRCARGPGG
jgi:predicted Zn finger-like uncharacterized protein